MSDDDPFADLSEALADDAADATDSDTTSESPDGDPNGDSPADVKAESDGDATAAVDDGRDPRTDAAFSYDDAAQRPFYARPETIDEFDSWLNYELERDLHDRGYQNIVVREMTDALLRTVVEEDLLDEVARRFERARENTSDR